MKTAKQKVVFSLMMTVGMVSIMMAYNALLLHGVTTHALVMMAVSFVPMLAVAFMLEALLVGRIVKKLHEMIVPVSAPAYLHILTMASLMVAVMCLVMTLIVTLATYGVHDGFTAHYGTAVMRNLPVALVAQIFIVGPTVRSLFGKIMARKAIRSSQHSHVTTEPAR